MCKPAEILISLKYTEITARVGKHNQKERVEVKTQLILTILLSKGLLRNYAKLGSHK